MKVDDDNLEKEKEKEKKEQSSDEEENLCQEIQQDGKTQNNDNRKDLLRILNSIDDNDNPMGNEFTIYTLSKNKNSTKKSSQHIRQLYKQFFASIDQYQINSSLPNILKSYSNQLNLQGIKFDKQNKINIKKKYTSNCHQIVNFQVQISLFVIQVQIYNIEDQKFDLIIQENSNILGNGTQGKIFKVPFLPGVMKRITFFHQKSSFISNIILTIIVEYAITKLLSVFQIGPKVIRPFMYDIIFSDQNAYFFIEQCVKIQQHLSSSIIQQKECQKQMNKIENELKTSLYRMHQLQIIHYDIKPQNIMYSPAYKKYVLIDFGMTESKLFPQGYLQMQHFKGTYFYCSDQMKKIFMRGKSEVDAYWNDCYCLSRSFEIIKKIIYQNTFITNLFGKQVFSQQLNYDQFNNGLEIFTERKEMFEYLKPILHLAVFSYLILQKLQQGYYNFLEKNTHSIQSQIYNYTNVFFQIGKNSTTGNILNNFIQIFITLHHQHLQTHIESKQTIKINGRNTDEIQQNLKDQVFLQRIKSQLNQIVSNNKSLKPFAQKYLHTCSTRIKQFGELFDFDQLSNHFQFNKDSSSLEPYYVGTKVNSQIISVGEVEKHYILYDYVSLLFDFFVENNEDDLKNQEKRKELINKVKPIFYKLSKYIEFFNKNLYQLEADKDHQQKDSLLRESIDAICPVLCDQNQFNHFIRLIAIEKYFIQVLSLVKMIALRIDKPHLALFVQNVEETRSEKILFQKHAVIKRYISDWIKYLYLKTQIKTGSINQCQWLVVAVSYQFTYLFHGYLMKLIQKIFRQNKDQALREMYQMESFVEKYEREAYELDAKIGILKWKVQRQKFDQLNDIKIFITHRLCPTIYQNQQINNKILYFQKFKTMIKLHYDQVTL